MKYFSLLFGLWVCIADEWDNGFDISTNGNSDFTVKGQSYKNNGLAGFGWLPINVLDNYGDTISFGSGVDIEACNYDTKGQIVCTLYGLPDRGWNTEGTNDFTSRIYKLKLTFDPRKVDGDVNLSLDVLDTLLLKGPDGRNTTGYEATKIIEPSEKYPELPGADIGLDKYAVCIDAESVRVLSNGHFLISDEYGPYVYEFDEKGQMLAAIKPVDALVPRDDAGDVSFNSGDPPINDSDIDEPTIKSGRAQNKGLEGMTVSPDGSTLFVMLQSATIQDGGNHATRKQASRIFRYELSQGSISGAKLTGEWVVALPHYYDNEDKPSKNPRVAAMSEILYVNPTQVLVLSRDNHHGRGQDNSTSIYRHIDVVDISEATNVLGTSADGPTGIVAYSNQKGRILNGTTPAEYYRFINYNDNSQLSKFGAHNGGAQDQHLLNEKWESLAFLPLKTEDGSIYLLSASDNDFISQNGHTDFDTLQYKDSSGYNLDSQVLIWSLDLKPFAGWTPHSLNSTSSTAVSRGVSSKTSVEMSSTSGSTLMTTANVTTESHLSTPTSFPNLNASASVAISASNELPPTGASSVEQTGQFSTPGKLGSSNMEGTHTSTLSNLSGGQDLTTTDTISVYTTYCPSPTTFVAGNSTYYITEPTTVTITECASTSNGTFSSGKSPNAVSSLAAASEASLSQPAVANGASSLTKSAILFLIPIVLL